jgi:two-component system invasion response regulator UvrY
MSPCEFHGSTALGKWARWGKTQLAARSDQNDVSTHTANPLARCCENAMIRLLIADDHTMFRNALRKLLAAEPDLEVVAEAADWLEVLESIRSTPIDVVVLDLSMPNGNGIDVIRQIRTLLPATPVLVLTMHHEEHYAAEALECGASGYITKDAAVQQLVVSIRRLAGGGKSIDPTIAQQLALAYTRGAVANPTIADLSRQELKIFEMLVHGKKGAQIAKDLGVRQQTVSTHKSRLLGKMNLKNQTELIRYAIEHRMFGL